MRFRIVSLLLVLPFLAAAPMQLERDVVEALAEPRSEMAPVVIRFRADHRALERRHPVAGSVEREERFDRFLNEWSQTLEGIDYDALSDEASYDWHLLRTAVERVRYRLHGDAEAREEARALLPFFDETAALAARRSELPPPEGALIAKALHSVAESAGEAKRSLRELLAKEREDPERPSAARCRLAWKAVVALRNDLWEFVSFRDGYDPLFTWWTARPAAAALTALDELARVLREEGMGVTADQPNAIVGTPIGSDALAEELRLEWIPYSAQELIAVADREFAWCEAQLAAAGAEMGFENWQDALEAIEFLRERDLVTIPPHAEETWRMAMMTPERQLITPFFTGGEVVSIAFPTAGMEHADKLMTLRGNNRAFTRAVVHHELIPGHHLQQWSEARFRTHRALFRTPFWTEGWALHWEMYFWDLDFARTPQERIGMLWWRAHRAARIQFSLRFHLGEWSAEECVEHLVGRLAHERANAEGEVRRSFSGDYPPLYQIAYLVGGLQLRALHHDLVGGGGMSDRAFHDEVLRQHNMPIEVVRAILRGERLPREARPEWRFDEELAGLRGE